MATLTVWKFDTPEGAAEAERKLIDLAKDGLVKVEDAATLSWPPEKKKPKTKQLNSLVGVGALSGAFWGWLFGLIFLVPILGLAVGAAAGALGGRATDIGIDDDFIKSVREKVQPGTSALFLLSSDAVIEPIRASLAATNPELIHTSLGPEEEQHLREMFGDEP